MQEHARDRNYLLSGKRCSALTEPVGSVSSILDEEESDFRTGNQQADKRTSLS